MWCVKQIATYSCGTGVPPVQTQARRLCHKALENVASTLTHYTRTHIAPPENDLIFSIGSCWEIAIKVSFGILKLAESYASFMKSALVAHEIELLPISLEHTAALAELPMHHRDPFDRLLAAQSLVEKFPIISADSQLDPYSVQRIW